MIAMRVLRMQHPLIMVGTILLFVSMILPSKDSSSLVFVTAFRTGAVRRHKNQFSQKRREQRRNDINGEISSFATMSSSSSSLHLALPPVSSSIVTDAMQVLPSYSSMMMSSMDSMIDSYGYCLKCHYYPTQCMTNAIITMIGDGIAQKQQYNQQQQQQKEEEEESSLTQLYEYKIQRGLVYFFKGFISAIWWSWWFEQADGVSHDLTTQTISSSSSVVSNIQVATHLQTQQIESIVQTVVNILLEQFLISPIVFTVWDIPLTSVMLRGSDIKTVPNEIRTKLGPLLVANAKVWMFANVIKYNIPYQYRILYSSLVSILSESINARITSTSKTMMQQQKSKLTELERSQQVQLMVESQLRIIEPSSSSLEASKNSQQDRVLQNNT